MLICQTQKRRFTRHHVIAFVDFIFFNSHSVVFPFIQIFQNLDEKVG
jgi:hypothetical protein